VTDKRFVFFLTQQPHCSSSWLQHRSSQLAVEIEMSLSAGPTPFAGVYQYRRYCRCYPLSIPSAVVTSFSPFPIPVYHKSSRFLRPTQHHRSIIKECFSVLINFKKGIYSNAKLAACIAIVTDYIAAVTSNTKFMFIKIKKIRSLIMFLQIIFL
jgi:hypothetical protein